MYEGIKDYLWIHPWVLATLCALPSLVLGVIVAWRENHHAGVANRLREDANQSRAEANRLRAEGNDLHDQLNKHVGSIARNTTKVPTEAERNAEKLRRRIGQYASVSEPHGNWGASGAQIVEVSDDNTVTLFVPAGYSSSSAWAVLVRCDKLHLVEPPSGLVQIKILERYGDVITLGEIRKWEDRAKPSGAGK